MTAAVAIKLGLTLYLGAITALDWRTRVIPLALTLPAMLGLAVWRLYQGSFGFLFAWFFIFALWSTGRFFGGGDAKLLMALFALFPEERFLLVLCLSVLAMGVPVLVARAWGKPLGATAQRLWERAGVVLAILGGNLKAGGEEARLELEKEGVPAVAFTLAGVIYAWMFV